MPLSLYTEPKLLDQLFGVCIGQVNQAIAAGTTAQTTLTVMGSVGSGNIDATPSANDILLCVKPGAGAAINQYTAHDVFLVTSATATQITFASRTVVAVRAAGDYIFNLGTTTTFTKFLYHNTVYVGLTTAGAQTTVSAVGEPATLPQGTINVASTTGFPNTTQIVLVDSSNGLQTVQYTGASGTTLTGCTGGTGTIDLSSVVMLVPTQVAILAAEPSSTGSYARVAVVNNAANFSAATIAAGVSPPATKLNAAAVTFPASSAAWSSGATVLDAFFIADASTLGGGNVLAWGYLTTAQAVNASGITPSFASSALTATLL